jgi:hypothetical protein
MTTENTFVDVSFLAEFVPYEGDGQAARLSHNGIFRTRITKAPYKRLSGGEDGFALTLEVVDDDANKGAVIYKSVPMTGQRSDGKSKGIIFGELLASLGYTRDEIQAVGKNLKLSPKSLSDRLTAEPKNICAVSAKAVARNGRVFSQADNFITPANLEKAVKSGQGLRDDYDLAVLNSEATKQQMTAPAAGGRAQARPTASATSVSDSAVADI